MHWKGPRRRFNKRLDRRLEEVAKAVGGGYSPPSHRHNYELWGGPVLLLLNLPKNAVAGTYIDVGSYMYAILLGMHAYGLGGKPLGSVAKYTDTIREVLGAAAMPEDEHLICGICIGWPTGGRDPRTTPDWHPSRLGLDETTRWVVDAAWA